jgi:DNA-binding IscR family transcriptional regulator
MHTTITEIAAAEKINESYVGRVLSPLAPDIVMRSWGTAEVS